MRMKLSIFGLVLAFGLGMTSSAQAVEFEDVTVPDKITLSGQTISLNGVGLREKFWVNVYVGALYLSQPTQSIEEAISQKGSKRIAMYFVHDAGRDAIVEAWNAGFKGNNTAEVMESIKTRIENFNSWFTDITAGDNVFLDYLPGEGTRVTIDGEVKGVIPGEDFYTAVMRIWLGPNPPGEDLKNGLLGLE